VFLIGRWLLAAFDPLRVASAMRPLDAADWAVDVVPVLRAAAGGEELYTDQESGWKCLGRLD